MTDGWTEDSLHPEPIETEYKQVIGPTVIVDYVNGIITKRETAAPEPLKPGSLRHSS